jgi:hypothetical protein
LNVTNASSKPALSQAMASDAGMPASLVKRDHLTMQIIVSGNMRLPSGELSS